MAFNPLAHIALGVIPLTPPPNRVHGAIRRIDERSWIIGGRLLLTRTNARHLRDFPLPVTTPGLNREWDDGDGGSYLLQDAPANTPQSQPMDVNTFRHRGFPLKDWNSPSLHLRHETGTDAAVWRAGEAFIKVRFISGAKRNATREHATLEFLHAKQRENPDSLPIVFPTVIHNVEIGDWYILILDRVRSCTMMLSEAWPSLNQTAREEYAGRIARMCHQMARWGANAMSGADGRELWDVDSRCLRSLNASNMGFYHGDLSIDNIIVDPGDLLESFSLSSTGKTLATIQNTGRLGEPRFSQ